MKKLLTNLTFGLMVLALISCDKNNEPLDTTLPFTPSENDLTALFQKNLDALKQTRETDHYRAGHHGIYEEFDSKNKVIIESFENSFLTPDNNQISDDIVLSFTEIYDRGTMLITNKPTVATIDSKKRLLLSEGEFYLNIKQKNGVELITKDDQTYFRISPKKTKELDEELECFIGKSDEAENTTWKKHNKMINFNKENEIDPYFDLYNYGTKNLNDHYGIFIDKIWGWYQIAKIATPNQNTVAPANIKKPNGLNSSNSRVFVAIKGMNTSLADESTYLPTGSEAYYILVSASGDKFMYIIKPATLVAANQTIEFKADEFKEASAQQLLEEINKLP